MGLYARNDVKGAKSWRYDFTVKGKRYTATLGNINKTRAKEMYEKARVAAREGRYELPIKKEDLIFDTFAQEYLDDYRLRRRARSTERHESSLKALKTEFRGKHLSAITPRAIDRYKSKRKKEGKSEVTINRELSFLKNMFNIGIQWEVVTENPVRKVEFYREDNSRTRFLSEEEEERLLAECKPFIYRVVLTALHTGFRRSELKSLKWGNITFEHRLITVEAAYAKNGEARSVPMSSTLASVLLPVRVNDPQAPVFLNRDGQPYRRFTNAFNAAVSRAGITDFKFHDLRHTFASRLVMRGVDLVTVKELLGHKKISMTLRYAHLSPGHKHSAIAVLDRVTPDSTPDPISPKSVLL